MTKTLDRTSEALSTMEKGITALVESGDWARYLKCQAAFHQYSFSNTMLILAQLPEASRIAGFKTWQKLGRQVRKGAKALWILAPGFRKLKPEAEATDDTDETQEKKVAYFRPVPVFDISQTEGEEIPSVVARLEGDDYRGLFERLAQFSGASGCPVSVEAVPGEANGYYSPREHRIAVSDRLTGVQRIKTLAHEMAHSKLHRDFEAYKAHRGDCELEAESVAFVVLHHFGIDSGAYSFGYVSTWKGGGPEAIKALKACAARIQETAKAIIEGVSGKRGADTQEE